jgi:hypothetical protein
MVLAAEEGDMQTHNATMSSRRYAAVDVRRTRSSRGSHRYA